MTRLLFVALAGAWIGLVCAACLFAVWPDRDEYQDWDDEDDPRRGLPTRGRWQ
jgi:hypothetical protein